MMFDNGKVKKTLYLHKVNGDMIAKVQRIINDNEGMESFASIILPVTIDGTTQGTFYAYIYYEVKPRVAKKLDFEEIFITEPEEEGQSLLK